MANEISKNELRWVGIFDKKGNRQYTITSNKDRSLYYIYDKDNNKLGKSKSPVELERKYVKEW